MDMAMVSDNVVETDNGLRKCVTMLWIWFVSGQGFSFFFSGVLVFMATRAAIVR